MCECGCGDTRGLVRFPARGRGMWYVLEVYPGCTDCGTDWALAVVRVKEGEEFGQALLDETPVGEFGAYENWGAKILDTRVLQRLYMEQLGSDDEFDPDPFALEEFVRQGGLIDTFRETRRPEQEGENG